MLISTTLCHPGLVRDQNEDSCVSNEHAQLWLVADGVGGNSGGQVASQLAVQTIDRRYRQGQSLKAAILDAHQAIRAAGQQQEALQGMATTIVAVCFSGDRYELAWLGDSRAYLIAPNRIQLLSSDHNVANELFQKGEISAPEVFDHPGQHELTQALGQFSLAEIPGVSGTLQADECLLLCTDGLSGVLTDQEIFDTVRKHSVRKHSTLKQLADDFLQQVLAAGAPDNLSLTLIKRADSSEMLPPEVATTEVQTKAGSTSTESRKASSAKKRSVLNKAPLTWLILGIVILIMLSLLI